MLITPGSTTLNECCHGCELGKMHKLPFIKSNTVYHNVGDCIVSDLVGPSQISPTSYCNKKFIAEQNGECQSISITKHFTDDNLNISGCWPTVIPSLFDASNNCQQSVNSKDIWQVKFKRKCGCILKFSLKILTMYMLFRSCERTK